MNSNEQRGKSWESEISRILAPPLAQIVQKIPLSIKEQITEIRLRVGQPLLFVLGREDVTAASDGRCSAEVEGAYHCSVEDIIRTFKLIANNSLYAYEEELKSGYLTIKGGHRVGLAGQATVTAGEVKSLKNICFLNIRIARDIKYPAGKIIRFLLEQDNQLQNTLIISPPRCGKTTLLRSIVKHISSGVPELNFPGVQVGVVDERSEIAACQNGVPEVDLGPRTDVLDACPKASGLLMLIRSMSPEVLVTDELGRLADANAVREALYAGVKVITSAHGKNLAEIRHRPHIGELIREDFFGRYIILSARYGPGTVEEIFDAGKKESLYSLAAGGAEKKLCG